jgi:hypothetical protein
MPIAIRVFDRSRKGLITQDDVRDTTSRLFLANQSQTNPSMRWIFCDHHKLMTWNNWLNSNEYLIKKENEWCI